MTEKYVTNILCSTINNKNSNFTSQLHTILIAFYLHIFKKDLDFPRKSRTSPLFDKQNT